jgi:hypothetical protein
MPPLVLEDVLLDNTKGRKSILCSSLKDKVQHWTNNLKFYKKKLDEKDERVLCCVLVQTRFDKILKSNQDCIYLHKCFRTKTNHPVFFF